MTLRLFVGLGNPGAQYRKNRHNAGFLWIDALVEGCRADWRKRFGGTIAECTMPDGTRIHALKPLEMMNHSGGAVGKFARYYDIAPKDILIAYDDLDLPLGKLRHKFGGGAGGHNGVRDIIHHLGADFHHLRFGIGHPGTKDAVTRHVLGNFNGEEHRAFDALIAKACSENALLIEEHFAEFMNRLTRHMHNFFSSGMAS